MQWPTGTRLGLIFTDVVSKPGCATACAHTEALCCKAPCHHHLSHRLTHDSPSLYLRPREATLHARVSDWHRSLRENFPDPARASPTSFNRSLRSGDESFSHAWGSPARREVRAEGWAGVGVVEGRHAPKWGKTRALVHDE